MIIRSFLGHSKAAVDYEHSCSVRIRKIDFH